MERPLLPSQKNLYTPEFLHITLTMEQHPLLLRVKVNQSSSWLLGGLAPLSTSRDFFHGTRSLVLLLNAPSHLRAFACTLPSVCNVPAQLLLTH